MSKDELYDRVMDRVNAHQVATDAVLSDPERAQGGAGAEDVLPGLREADRLLGQEVTLRRGKVDDYNSVRGFARHEQALNDQVLIRNAIERAKTAAHRAATATAAGSADVVAGGLVRAYLVAVDEYAASRGRPEKHPGDDREKWAMMLRARLDLDAALADSGAGRAGDGPLVAEKAWGDFDPEDGLLRTVPDAVRVEFEREARNHTNLWTSGNKAARQSFQVAVSKAWIGGVQGASCVLASTPPDRGEGAALPGVEEIAEALKPFAAVADLDIGDSELDFDYFMPAAGHNKAPRLTVGNLRRAAAIRARLAQARRHVDHGSGAERWMIKADALAAAAGSGGAEGWLPIGDARKDRTPYLLKLKDRIPLDRKDLRRWDGLQFVGQHPGLESDGFDIGWAFAAPVGRGGFPDEWFDGFRPLPPRIEVRS